MCIIAFAYQSHPTYPLILIGNRDEFYSRPTQRMHWWDEELLAGKDLTAGGTWLGVTKAGKLATLTNYRDIPGIKSEAKSRGELPINYLKGGMDPHSFLIEVSGKSEEYNGFNLLLWENHQMFHFSNYEGKINEIAPGIHTLSNALLDTPWFKTEKLHAAFQQCVNNERIKEDMLFNTLLDQVQSPDERLPQTGLPLRREKDISSVFIKTVDYGTCSSTMVLVDHKNEITVVERSYNSHNQEEIRYKWKI